MVVFATRRNCSIFHAPWQIRLGTSEPEIPLKQFGLSFILIINLLSITSLSTAHAQTPPAFSPEIRLLFHGTKMIVAAPEKSEKPGIGLAVWVTEPNLLDTNPQVQATVGLRLTRPEGWVEILGGGVFSPTTSSPAPPVFDLRAFAAPAKHLHVFGEVSAYSDAFYFFGQADVPIRRNGDVALKLGVEVEGAKTWEGHDGFLAAGPHVVIPWHEHFATVVTCQIRGKHSPAGPETDVVGRLYAVIDF